MVILLQVKSSSVPFFAHLRQLMAHDQVDRLKLVADDILDIFESNLNNARFMPYMFSFLDQVCSSGCLDVVFKSISQRLFTLIRTEMSSGSKPLKVTNGKNFLFSFSFKRVRNHFRRIQQSVMNVYLSFFFSFLFGCCTVVNSIDRPLLPPAQRRWRNVWQSDIASDEYAHRSFPTRAQNYGH